MFTKKGFTLIELFVTLAVIGLLLVMAGTAFKLASHKNNDARRVTDVSNIIISFSAAAEDGAVLCNASGSDFCSAGSLVHECAIYQKTCSGAAEEDVANEYINLQNVKDPVYLGACEQEFYSECGYTFVELTDISEFTIGFSTQGDSIQGLGLGHSHSANQDGFVY